MKPGKRRRYEYRMALKAQGESDRFSDMMRAVIGGGTKACSACGLARPVATMRDDGACEACAAIGTRLKVPSPAPALRPAVTPAEPNVVYVDASYRDGCAGLAVVGALGDYSRWAEAVSSTHAEWLALRWAMDIAREMHRKDLTFRTDCQAAFKAFHMGKARNRWVVEQIPRRRNQAADRMAWDARVGVAAV